VIGVCVRGLQTDLHVCNAVSELLFTSDLWKDLTSHYNLKNLQPCIVPGEPASQELFESHTASLLDVYDLLEYGFCELRRLLWSSVLRASAGERKKQHPWRVRWEESVRLHIAGWRDGLLSKRRVT
jgi:hypothetical protein